MSCGSCGAPMRYDEATEDHEALYVCHQKHRTGTEIGLQAHTTDRLVISGVLSAVLTGKSIATVRSAHAGIDLDGVAGATHFDRFPRTDGGWQLLTM